MGSGIGKYGKKIYIYFYAKSFIALKNCEQGY